MRLACPNCDARYEVPDDAIPEGGRDVQCSNCGHAWFQPYPEAELAAEEEAALYGDDLPGAAAQPEATAQGAPQGGPQAAGQPGGAASPPPAPSPMPGSGPSAAALEDSVLAVLREEAQREAEARRLEAERQEARRAEAQRAEAERQMQTQPDLGIEAAVRAAVAEAVPRADTPREAPRDERAEVPAAGAAMAEPPAEAEPAAAPLTPTQRRLAMLKGEDPDAPPPAPARAPARRDLLPDVEEINSTLQPGDGADAGPDVDALPDLTKRSGFRTGFLLALFVLGVAAVIYLAAPSIIASIPALEGPMTAYVAAVDGLRIWLNDLMSSASDSLNPATGP